MGPEEQCSLIWSPSHCTPRPHSLNQSQVIAVQSSKVIIQQKEHNFDKNLSRWQFSLKRHASALPSDLSIRPACRVSAPLKDSGTSRLTCCQSNTWTTSIGSQPKLNRPQTNECSGGSTSFQFIRHEKDIYGETVYPNIATGSQDQMCVTLPWGQIKFSLMMNGSNSQFVVEHAYALS